MPCIVRLCRQMNDVGCLQKLTINMCYNQTYLNHNLNDVLSHCHCLFLRHHPVMSHSAVAAKIHNQANYISSLLICISSYNFSTVSAKKCRERLCMNSSQPPRMVKRKIRREPDFFVYSDLNSFYLLLCQRPTSLYSVMLNNLAGRIELCAVGR